MYYLAGMLTVRIDRMEQVDQVVLKCGAILGCTFTREMLDSIIPQGYKSSASGAIRRMVDQGILGCASVPKENVNKGHTRKASRADPNPGVDVDSCKCKVQRNYMWISPAECQYMGFKSPIMQETASGLFVESARQSLHQAAAEFLELKAHKCSSCGGGDFALPSVASKEFCGVPTVSVHEDSPDTDGTHLEEGK